MPALPYGVYAIVDGGAPLDPASTTPLDLVSAFVRGGAVVVQLRLKGWAAGAMVELARAAKARCAGHALLVINDRADVAKLAGADGVHLGQDDLPVAAARALLGPDALIGLSTHSDREQDAADAGGPDYIGFGPVFATRSKPGALLPDPHGAAGLARAVRRGHKPVVAIGGITAANAGEVARAGARCAAAIAALTAAPDPEARCRELVQAFAGGRR